MFLLFLVTSYGTINTHIDLTLVYPALTTLERKTSLLKDLEKSELEVTNMAVIWVIAARDSVKYNYGGSTDRNGEVIKRETRRLPDEFAIGKEYPIISIHRCEYGGIGEQRTEILVPNNEGEMVWLDLGFFRYAVKNAIEMDGQKISEELKGILTKFAESGWNLIDKPAKEYLSGVGDRITLVKALEQADEQCGSCGCEFDPLYKRALELL